MCETHRQGDVGHRCRFAAGPQRYMRRLEPGALQERGRSSASPLAKPCLQASYAHSELRRDRGYGGPARRPLPKETFSFQNEAATGRPHGIAETFAVVVRMTMQK